VVDVVDPGGQVGNGDAGVTASVGWTPPVSYEVSTRDGRTLRYCLYGPEDGCPVIDHQGTPGTRLWSPQLASVVARSTARVLVYDRPGYGGSTRQPGRSIADVAADVAVLADARGWDRFGVVGVSGGGPHALACGALLPARVTRCAAVVSPAPYDRAGLAQDSWFAGMSPGNVAEFTAALQGEPVYRPLVERLGREAVDRAEQGEPAVPSGYDLPESDLAEMRRRLTEPASGRLERVRAAWLGTDGWIDDALALVQPWGFDVAHMRVPVTVWYGPDDVLCPHGHAEWLIAHVPGAQARELPGGHVLSDDSLAEIINWAAG
jgi:pimeloyl-ACP methyl ester carboxylesterase